MDLLPPPEGFKRSPYGLLQPYLRALGQSLGFFRVSGARSEPVSIEFIGLGPCRASGFRRVYVLASPCPKLLLHNSRPPILESLWSLVVFQVGGFAVIAGV